MSILDIIFIAAIIYPILPIKHPCDYGSYTDWWKDRKNWHKGYWK